MIQRLWNFVKRHKKKFIGTAFVCGGGYVAWRVLKPKIMNYVMERLMKQMGEGDLLKELMAELQDPEDQKAKKRAKFSHNQQVSDNHTKSSLLEVEKRLKSCFELQEAEKMLKQAQSKEEKLKYLEAMQVECLARAMSGLYVLHLLLLLHRVEFNIVGREMLGSDGNAAGDVESSSDTEVFVAFIDALKLNDSCWVHICSAMRDSVKACWSGDSMTVQTKVSTESFRSFLLNVCNRADAALLEGGKGPATLLPESLDASAAPKLKQLLDETRDYLESPQFLEVFRSTIADAVTHFVSGLSEHISDPSEGAVGPLPRDGTAVIAKLGGECVQRSQAMFATGDTAGYIRRFGDGNLVVKLCEDLYFEGGKVN